MADDGWIKLYRCITEHWVWKDKPFSKGQAWIDILLLSNHDDNKFVFGNELIDVERGSFITSETKLADRWGWSRHKVRDFLNLLESDSMLVKKSDVKRTRLKVLNYSVWQNSPTTKGQKKDSCGTAAGQLRDTNKNDKNDKNDKNINIRLQNSIDDFKEFRKKIKKPMTDRAVELLIKELDKLAPDDEIKIAILNQSIVNGWQGVFPLKQQELQTNHKETAYERAKREADEMLRKEGIILE